MDIIMVRKTGL